MIFLRRSSQMIKENFEIQIKRIKGCRSMRLKIDKNGLPVLTLPFWIPKKIGLMWVEKQHAWIQQNTFEPVRFHDTQKILFLGQEVTIRHSPTHLRTHVQDGILWVSGEENFLPRRVGDFIKKEFLEFLRPQIAEKEKMLGVKHKRISLRDTTSRWGSCSSGGVLSFCWRLAMTPDFVIDYLIAHEVAHLKHMNHSATFWKSVTELTPHTQAAKKWLKENAKDLPSLK